MKRVLAILRLLFAHSWTVGLMSGLAVLSLVIGVVAGPRFVTGNFVVAMTLIWSAGAFRQIVSDQRLSMLPQFRTHAVAALVLVALTIGFAAGVSAVWSPSSAEADSAIGTGLVTFALASFILLASQWFSTLPGGMLLHMLSILLLVRYGVAAESDENLLARHGWGAALAALLGWHWLLVTLARSPRVKGPIPWLRIEHVAGYRSPGHGSPSEWLGLTPLNVGRPARPTGTMMRGGIDGWPNRIGSNLFWVLGFGSLWMLWMYAAAPGWRERPADDAIVVFLAVSFGSTTCISPLRFTEWPTRLRYVWLRVRGDRAALWRLLERTIWEEAGIVAAIATAAAAGLFLATDTSVAVLAAYVVGCTISVLIGAYGVMVLRLSGATVAEVNFVFVLCSAPAFWLVLLIGPQPDVLGSLILIFGVLTSICRYVLRKEFQRVDWCAVKPWRSSLARTRASQ